MKKKITKIFYVCQFAFVLLPLALIADFIPYIIEAGSITKGVELTIYDAMLNCLDFFYSRIILSVCLFITVVGLVGSFVIKMEDTDLQKGADNESVD